MPSRTASRTKLGRTYGPLTVIAHPRACGPMVGSTAATAVSVGCIAQAHAANGKTFRKNAAVTLRQNTIHEPAMIIGSTLPCISIGSGLFSTAEAGNAHVQRKGRQPFIGAALAAHSSIRKATADGSCAYHVSSLAVKQQLASNEEVKEVKNSLILEWVWGKSSLRRLLHNAPPLTILGKKSPPNSFKS